jgi:hypothetical protein
VKDRIDGRVTQARLLQAEKLRDELADALEMRLHAETSEEVDAAVDAARVALRNMGRL